MLDIYLGNFPDLEKALYERIRSLKEKDPFSPVAVVVPSGYMMSGIKLFLAHEKGLNLMGVHFLLFHTLALKILEERYGSVRGLVNDKDFFVVLLRHILINDPEGVEMFHHFSETIKGCGPLLSTIEDLREAKVSPDNIIEALREGIIDPVDIDKLISLIVLYSKYLAYKERAGVRDYSDIGDMATELVHASRYLGNFKEIIYYGFYDLTQVQYDLFREITTYYNVSLYFPLIEKANVFTFSRRFYDTYIQGLAHGEGKIRKLSDSMITDDGKESLFPFGHMCRLISVSGSGDEILTVAKEILRLVEREGYRFIDIGVVARDINEYGLLIKRIFRKHMIPFVTSATEPINIYEATKGAYLLLSILKGDFRRSDIIDLASSHVCKIQDFCPDGIRARPDLWDLVTRSIGITKGIQEWKRLDKYVSEGYTLQREESNVQAIKGEELEGLKRFIISLKDDIDSLPPASSWDEYVERFLLLLNKYIRVEDPVRDTLLSMKAYSMITGETTLLEFINILMFRLDTDRIPAGDKNISGVHVLDAMSARGISFKVLFLIGMNEKVFPRYIREDPLLRDSVRAIMETSIGYKVGEKLRGYEEEKLLFYLLLSSVRERIYLLYRRSDDEGNVRIPSWYIGEIGRSYPLKEERIPRRLEDKFRDDGDSSFVTDLFHPLLLTHKEFSIRSILKGEGPLRKKLSEGLNMHGERTPRSLLRGEQADTKENFLTCEDSLQPAAGSFNHYLYLSCLETVKEMERRQDRLTGFDGLVGHMEACWEERVRMGLSPTSLEDYAVCPFLYFARHILSLEGFDYPAMEDLVSPVILGNLCHRVLRRFYGRFVEERIFPENREIEKLLEEDAEAVFSEFEENQPTGYPLLWYVMKEKLTDTMKELVQRDIKGMSQSGFKPCLLEVEVQRYFNDEVFFKGIIDRVDLRSDGTSFRIIDYKYRSGRHLKRYDENLRIAALRGRRLQPPLYLMMAEILFPPSSQKKEIGQDKFFFYYIAPNFSGNSDEYMAGFSMDSLEVKGEIENTISRIIEEIKSGLFFAFPGEYCRYCEYKSVCRKDYAPSRWRAERDRMVKEHIAIKRKK